MSTKQTGIDFAQLTGDVKEYFEQIVSDSARDEITALLALLRNRKIDLSQIKTHMTLGRSMRLKKGESAGTISFSELMQLHKTGMYGGAMYRNADKEKTPVVWLTDRGFRPEAEDWATWNGGFLIDLDLMDKTDLPENYPEIISELKKALHKRLCKYYWYAWSTSSYSGTGLHIRTHSEVALFKRLLGLFFEARGEKYDTAEIACIAFYLNLLHKYALCYKALMKCVKTTRQFGEQYDEAWLAKSIDGAMFKIAQCAVVAYDPAICVNPHFKAEDMVVEIGRFDKRLVSEFIALPRVQKTQMFRIGKNRTAGKDFRPLATDEHYDNLLKDIDTSHLDKAAFAKVDKEYDTRNERYKLYWFTEVYFYQYTGHDRRQAQAFCSYLFDHASKSYRKLQSNMDHIAQKNYCINSEIKTIMDRVITGMPNLRMRMDIQTLDIRYEHVYHLDSGEYVSKYLNEILGLIPLGGIGVLAAGAGTGKTDAVMALAETPDMFPDLLHADNGIRILIIEPYKGIVISKFKRIEHMAELLYEDKRFCGERPVCVALVDKFLDIDLEKVHYDYIVIDESHLLAMSEYRAKCGLVMNKLKTRHYPATKILLMTGTPVFEQQFFPDAHYFRIDKEETRRKTVNITQCTDAYDRMCRDMIEDIAQGRKIIFIVKSLNQADSLPPRIEEFSTLGREIRYDRFFSRARNTEAAVNILNNRPLGDADVVFVSAVLSVGIDITQDKNVVFYTSHALSWLDIEQYGNRLRRCDITFNMYLAGNGANPQLRYSDFGYYRQRDREDRDEFILAKLNEEKYDPDHLLKEYGISYFLLNRITGCWESDPVLKKISEKHRQWQNWSRQLIVSSAYMERLGYEVNYNKHIQKAAPRLSAQEESRIRKQRSNAKYRFVKELLNDHAAALREATYEAQQYFSIQYRPDTIICLSTEVEKDTIFTEDADTMKVIYAFLTVCSRLSIPFEGCIAFIRSQMSKNNQISLPQIVHLTHRLYYNRRPSSRIPELIGCMESFPQRYGEEITKAELADMVGELIETYYGHTNLCNDPKTQDNFERLIKHYYKIQKLKNSERYAFIRYDTTFEKEHDVLFAVPEADFVILAEKFLDEPPF